jgi:hypothetical protein
MKMVLAKTKDDDLLITLLKKEVAKLKGQEKVVKKV